MAATATPTMRKQGESQWNKNQRNKYIHGWNKEKKNKINLVRTWIVKIFLSLLSFVCVCARARCRVAPWYPRRRHPLPIARDAIKRSMCIVTVLTRSSAWATFAFENGKHNEKTQSTHIWNNMFTYTQSTEGNKRNANRKISERTDVHCTHRSHSATRSRPNSERVSRLTKDKNGRRTTNAKIVDFFPSRVVVAVAAAARIIIIITCVATNI